MKTILTVLITAALTSLVWLIIFNMQSAPETRTVAAPTTPAKSANTSPPASSQLSRGSAADIAALTAKRLTIPVAGVQAARLIDNYGEARSDGARAHQANDIMAARGTPVVAVEDGRIAKLFNSKLGGITIYQFDPSETYSYYYAHLDHYAAGLAEGQEVKRGQLIGYVGFTGDALESAPHLHFAIARLNPDKHWWDGSPIDPYRPLRGN